MRQFPEFETQALKQGPFGPEPCGEVRETRVVSAAPGFIYSVHNTLRPPDRAGPDQAAAGMRDFRSAAVHALYHALAQRTGSRDDTENPSRDPDIPRPTRTRASCVPPRAPPDGLPTLSLTTAAPG